MVKSQNENIPISSALSETIGKALERANRIEARAGIAKSIATLLQHFISHDAGRELGKWAQTGDEESLIEAARYAVLDMDHRDGKNRYYHFKISIENNLARLGVEI